ncbi:HNH endonuclease [Bacillus toyonensis]|uniref:HNH endonuclease n=1 Tax=Bacillus toyonensis TaxID=155322 RepID=UPI0015D50287|nr:HNH endonuclease [Bacillus toyonensis]
MKNNFEIKGNIVEIDCKRRNGDIVKTIISIEDFDKVVKYEGTWYAQTDSKNRKIYIIGKLPDKDKTGGQRVILLHRIITDCPDGFVPNHISGNTLDNTRENLEVVTVRENIIHGKQQLDVIVRKTKRFPFKNDWYEVFWIIDNEIEFPVSIHTTKEEALIRKMTFEARQRPERLIYTDYPKRFKELGYDWSLVPFTHEYDEHIPKLMTLKELRKLKGVQVK